MSDNTMKWLLELDRQMGRLMSNLSEYGAADSEPDGVYQYAIVQQLERIQSGDGKGPKIPRSIAGWQLYSMKGSGMAAKQLGQHATKVCGAIRAAVSKGHWREVCKWAEDKCWRVDVSWD